MRIFESHLEDRVESVRVLEHMDLDGYHFPINVEEWVAHRGDRQKDGARKSRQGRLRGESKSQLLHLELLSNPVLAY